MKGDFLSAPQDQPPKSEQLEDLAQRLAETEAALQALTAGQVDAVVDPVSGIPILLHQAQVQLRLAHDELEERVRERTAELARTNRLLQALIETMPVGAVISDAAGNVLVTNVAAREILGSAVHGSVESPERSYTPHLPNGTLARPQEMPLAQALQEGRTVRDVELLIRRADGKERTILASAAPVKDEAGEIISGITVFQDITERKQSEMALRQYAGRLQILHSAGQVILSAGSVDEIVEAVLPFTREMVCCPWASVLAVDQKNGEAMVLGAHPDGGAQFRKGNVWQLGAGGLLEELAESELSIFEDVSVLDAPPALIEALQAEGVNSLVSLPLVAQGEMLGILNLGLDDSAGLMPEQRTILHQMADQMAIGLRQARLQEELKHHAEQLEAMVTRRTTALRASEARFRTIFEDSVVGIALVDTAGQIVTSNPALQSMLGYSERELAGTTMDAYSHPDDIEASRELFLLLAAGALDHYQVEMRFVRKDGQVRWSALTVSRVERTRGDKRWLAVAAMEDTTQRKEAQAAQRKSELRQRLALSAVGGGIYDHPIPLDDTAYHDEGWAQILGYQLGELPPYADFMEWLYNQVHPDDRSQLEQVYGDFIAGRTESYQAEVRLRHKSGQWIWVEALAEASARDEQGRATHIVGLMRDIGERKEAEALLIQSEKLAITGKLTAQLAHEINNPLQSVIGCLGLAEEAAAEGREVGDYVNIAMREMKRVASIVAQLRDVHSQPAKREKKAVDINDLLGQVVRLTQGQWERHGLRVIWERQDDLPRLVLDPDRIRQLFLNLVLNAIQAMPREGELRIGTEQTEDPAGVKITVADTGRGIPPDILPHVFEPFFSTKPEGMGLGLFVSQEIVEDHGGRIEVNSQPAVGTTIGVWLPATQEEPALQTEKL